MIESSMTLGEYLRKINVDLDGDVVREGVRLLARLIMEGEVTEQIGAGKYQRTPELYPPAKRWI
jgi:transposase-like protein